MQWFKKRFERPGRRGSVLVLSAAMMIFVLGMVAFTTDLGFVTLAKSKQQVAVDSAALAGVDMLKDGTNAVDSAVNTMMAANEYGSGQRNYLSMTRELGHWDTVAKTFTVVNDYRDANAIRLLAIDTGVPAFFGPVFGQRAYQTRTEAIAMRGGAAPRDISLVIDCSGSMGSLMSNGKTRMTNAIDAAKALVNALRTDDRICLSVFSWNDLNRDKYGLTGHIETDMSFNKSPTLARIGQLKKALYASTTNIGGGLRAGLDNMKADPTPRPAPGPYDPPVEKLVVLMTDGQVNEAEPYPYPDDGPDATLPPLPYRKKSYDDRTAVTKWATVIKARGYKLHCIALSDEAHDALLEAAASPSQNGAVYYHYIRNGSGDANNLINTFRKIGEGHAPRLVR